MENINFNFLKWWYIYKILLNYKLITTVIMELTVKQSEQTRDLEQDVSLTLQKRK